MEPWWTLGYMCAGGETARSARVAGEGSKGPAKFEDAEVKHRASGKSTSDGLRYSKWKRRPTGEGTSSRDGLGMRNDVWEGERRVKVSQR